MRVEFYYSSKEEPWSIWLPTTIDNILKRLDQLQRMGVPVEAVDVAEMDDVFRFYHKAMVGPSLAKRAVFGLYKGALEADFGRSCPALYVYEDAADRYPSDVYPRIDREKGVIGIESALEELVEAHKVEPFSDEEEEQPEGPTVRVYPPEEALQRARPLPPRGRLVIEDVSDEEWAAFQEALAET